MSVSSRKRPGLWFVLAGLSSLLASAAFLGCGGGQTPSGPVSAAKSQYKVAEDDKPASPAIKTPIGDQPLAAKPSGETGTPATAAKTSPESIPPGVPADGAAGRVTDEPLPGAKPAGGQPAAPTDEPPLAPAVGAASKPVDLKTLPEGRDELLSYLEQLQRRPPQGQTQQEMIENYRQIHQARINAADKLWSIAKDVPDQIAAAQSKLDAMRELAQAGFPNADKQLTTYCRQLQKSPEKEVARLGRLILFDRAAEALARGETNDVQPVLTELKALAADGADNPRVLMIVSGAAMNLQLAGFKDAALDAFRAIAKVCANSKDPNITQHVKTLLERARVIELDFEGKLRAMMEGKANSVAPVTQAIAELLKGEQPGPGMLEAVVQASQLLEMTDNYEQALQTYAAIETAFQNHEDKNLAEQAAKVANNGRRRVALVGKPFAVEGVLIDGKKFDWSKYKGKYVLVDFWATWCGPCMQEIPNVQKYYELYRGKGFEVVGVNMDNELDQVKQMFELQPLPWTTVVSADDNARGFDTPLAVKCGVDAIPFMILLEPTGKVLALHVRGERLGRKLAQLLGAAEPAAGGAKPAPAKQPPEAVPPPPAP